MTLSKINGLRSPNYKNSHKKTQRNTTQRNCEYCLRDLYGLPKSITIESSQNYYPNIKKLSSDELFDIQFYSGTKLSNGSVLIRPVILSLGEVDIKPVKDFEKVYSVTILQNKESKAKQTKFIKEEDLLKNRSLSRGAIKEVSSGLYEMVFLDKEGKKQNITASKKECLKLLKDNYLYL